MPYYRLEMPRIVDRTGSKLAEARNYAKSKLLQAVERIEHDVYGQRNASVETTQQRYLSKNQSY